MVLVDTSVWVDHFRKSDKELSQLLAETRVRIHPFVIGEIACGHMPHQREVLTLLHALPEVVAATSAEVLAFINAHKLSGRGVGLVDMHLLASVELTKSKIWTADKILSQIAHKLGRAYEP